MSRARVDEGSKPGPKLRGLEKIARDLDVLVSWYVERPGGLTFRALGERHGLSEAGTKAIVDGQNAAVARVLFGAHYAKLFHWRARQGATQGQILAWLESLLGHASELIRRVDA